MPGKEGGGEVSLTKGGMRVTMKSKREIRSTRMNAKRGRGYVISLTHGEREGERGIRKTSF